MKRFSLLTLFVLVLSLVLSACAPTPTATPTPAPTAAALTFTDGLKRTVSLPAAAKKIVSLAPSNTELLFAVGAGGQVIGRDEFSDYPAEAKKIANIGGSMGKLNLEQIAALQPDLVLAGEINTPEQVKAFEDLKLPVYYLPNPTTLDGLYANIETVGKLTGHVTEAQKLNADLKKRVKVVTDAAAKLTDRPKVFYELDGSEPAKPWTAGPGNFVDSLIKTAGGENVAAGLKSAYAQFSQEELLVTNPAIILLGDAAYGVTPQQVAQRPGWAGIKAVKDGKILAFDDNLVSRPGPRLVDGLEMLFKLIHP